MHRHLLALLALAGLLGCDPDDDRTRVDLAPTLERAGEVWCSPNADSYDAGGVEIGSEGVVVGDILCEDSGGATGPEIDPVEVYVANVDHPAFEVFVYDEIPLGVLSTMEVAFTPTEEGLARGMVTIDTSDGVVQFEVLGTGVAAAEDDTIAYTRILVVDTTPATDPSAHGTAGIDLDAAAVKTRAGDWRNLTILSVSTGWGDCSATFGKYPDLSDIDDPLCGEEPDGDPSWISLGGNAAAGGEGGSIELGAGVPLGSGDRVELAMCDFDGNESYDVYAVREDGTVVLLAEGVRSSTRVTLP